MKFIATFILTILLGYIVYVLNDVLPWWTVAVAAFIAAAIVPLKPWASFLAGFLGVALLWWVLAAVIDNANAGVMANRMAEVLPLEGNKMLLIIITGVVGGLVGGLAALTGSFARKKAA